MPEHNEVKPFSKQARDLQPGIYEHYKGGRYKVLDIGRKEDTLEEVVIYQTVSESMENDIWIRAIDDFCATVSRDGEEAPRFTLVRKDY